MNDARQRYTPITGRDDDIDAAQHLRASGPLPRRLPQAKQGQQETKRMRSAHIPAVNPVTAGDRSVAGKKRVYEKGKKNRTRS